MTRWTTVLWLASAIALSACFAADSRHESKLESKSDSRTDSKTDQKAEPKTDPTQGTLKYHKMSKVLLQEELKKMQVEILGLERKANQAKTQVKQATDAYEAAPDDQKPEALILMLDAKAAARKPCDAYEKLKKDFLTAQAAYLEIARQP